MKLYELSAEYAQFLQLIESEDFDEKTIADTLESIKGEIEEKGKNVAAHMQNLEAEVDAFKAAEQRISMRRKAAESRAEWLKNYLRDNMERCGISKIECAEFSVTLRKAADVCNITDESKLPESYTKTKTVVTPDKAAILKALKDGQDVPGAEIGKAKAALVIK